MTTAEWELKGWYRRAKKRITHKLGSNICFLTPIRPESGGVRGDSSSWAGTHQSMIVRVGSGKHGVWVPKEASLV